MTRIDTLLAAWDDTDDLRDDVSNDYRDRAMMPLASEARERNRKRAPFVVQCDHCGRKYRRMAAGVQHVQTCGPRHWTRAYGK